MLYAIQLMNRWFFQLNKLLRKNQQFMDLGDNQCCSPHLEDGTDVAMKVFENTLGVLC